MKKLLATVLVSLLIAAPASAASVSRTYSYFSVGGRTFEELQFELQSRGPKVKSTGLRHAGATRMEFKTRIKYGETAKRCKVVNANVSSGGVILPRWTQRRRAAADVRLFWTRWPRHQRHEEAMW